MSSSATIVWFRRDLRLDDNPALVAAVRRGGPIVPVFIWDPREGKNWVPGAAARWWLHQSLAALDAELRRYGSRLVIRAGDALARLQDLARETGSDTVFWNRRYEPATRQSDKRITAALRREGFAVETFNAALLFEPDEVTNKSGRPFQVFTPFWRACMERPPSDPLAAPTRLPGPRRWPESSRLSELELEPTIDWTGGIRAVWQPGWRGAGANLTRFLEKSLSNYATDRDRPGIAGTSRLSPHLHFGEISPRRVWHAVSQWLGQTSGSGRRGDGSPAQRGRQALETRRTAAEAYLRQLVWREFAYHLLHHFPHTAEHPFRTEFAAFPWARNARALRAWQRGRTGYPLVDAGMRQLWTTGWMHNRVRMVVASFLTKHLLIAWETGARWFWDTLVDADLANNTFGWQWTAGCGADPAPYFRIFNPVSQGEKFDPDGDYVRQWVPELAALPPPWIHRPWEASSAALTDAGVKLGQTYPNPIVDHAEARERALAAFARIRNSPARGRYG